MYTYCRCGGGYTHRLHITMRGGGREKDTEEEWMRCLEREVYRERK
jgi:hypothetical protein